MDEGGLFLESGIWVKFVLFVPVIRGAYTTRACIWIFQAGYWMANMDLWQHFLALINHYQAIRIEALTCSFVLKQKNQKFKALEKIGRKLNYIR